MQDFAYFDETLDLNLTQSYQLSIQVSLDGLSFCIYDPVQNKFIVLISKILKYDEFNEYLDLIENLLENDEILKLNYKTVKLNWISPKYSIIPAMQFNKENLKEHFEFTQKMDDLDEIHMNELPLIKSNNIFTIPNQLANIFTRKYPTIKFFNQQTTYTHHIFNKYHSSHRKMFISIYNAFIDIHVIENGKLLLCNNFHYKNEMDIIYYVMNIFNQYHNKQGFEVYLAEFVDKKSELYKKLIQFIGSIKFDKHPSNFAYSYTFNKIQNHQYINLFNLTNCE